MTTKHFLSDPSTLVPDALYSQTQTNPSLAFDRTNRILYRRPGYEPQVAIISGGGSGHEPSFAGYVGAGILSATVAGTIFASPSTRQISTAIHARVIPTEGVLAIVLNYTGDVLHFGMAVEQAKADGFKVEMVVVEDDVGVGRAQAGKVGRRGLAGCVLVHKIAGALAATGGNLQQVASIARLVNENIVTVGASLDHVHIPGHGPMDPSGILRENEIEIGMGVHNEPGCERVTMDLPQLVTKLLAQLISQEDKDRAFVNVNSNEVVLMINNLGGLSNIELGGITTEVLAQLSDTWSIQPVRVLSGTYMTSLNGPGFSITLLNVVNTNLGGPSMIQLLDAPAECTGWSAAINKETWEANNQSIFETELPDAPESRRSDLLFRPNDALPGLIRASEAIIAAEPQITRFDTVMGDGDCGVGLRRGAEALLDITKKPLPDNVLETMGLLISTVAENMDGTSGALISIFLSAISAALLSIPSSNSGPIYLEVSHWAEALSAALGSLQKYTSAREGDRTLMDALVPFVRSLRETRDLASATKAAMAGARGTQGMKAGLGRSVYIGGDGYKEVPDPGAWAVGLFLSAFAGIEDTAEDKGSSEEEYEII